MSAAHSQDRLQEIARAGEQQFAALEAELGDTHEGRIELGRRALARAQETFGDGLTVASSMGDEVLVHLVGTTLEGADVFFLDTGYHFAETLGTRDAYDVMLPITIRTIYPRLTVAEQDAEHGPQLHDRDPNLCCAMRKVEPLNRALEEHDARVTGMRREDAPTRTDITIVGWDERRGMVKLNPIAGWTRDDVDQYAAEKSVFLNPLRQSGYASIGCAPCTRPVAEGEDARAGRWSGTDKVECGLHT
ncbi:phosphoadenylyl-sulfate reductase [Janibacter limosus]|uniref:Phosphoadenylyl-sulfate reductase n=1 Tax=Janibacter limosus TaxID=53458 RepID=A0AC61U0Q8_9MICO|nr:phosphoadenylyl-sulfate reductase [Janibacter limosus]UUZ43595.1 phosphoadenylyl-sulfate reductase [Janibacter limosus]